MSIYIRAFATFHAIPSLVCGLQCRQLISPFYFIQICGKFFAWFLLLVHSANPIIHCLSCFGSLFQHFAVLVANASSKLLCVLLLNLFGKTFVYNLNKLKLWWEVCYHQRLMRNNFACHNCWKIKTKALIKICGQRDQKSNEWRQLRVYNKHRRCDCERY